MSPVLYNVNKKESASFALMLLFVTPLCWNFSCGKKRSIYGARRPLCEKQRRKAPQTMDEEIQWKIGRSRGARTPGTASAVAWRTCKKKVCIHSCMFLLAHRSMVTETLPKKIVSLASFGGGMHWRDLFLG